MIEGSIDKAKTDVESAEKEKNRLKNYQNELGLREFSKGSFKRQSIILANSSN